MKFKIVSAALFGCGIYCLYLAYREMHELYQLFPQPLTWSETEIKTKIFQKIMEIADDALGGYKQTISTACMNEKPKWITLGLTLPIFADCITQVGKMYTHHLEYTINLQILCIKTQIYTAIGLAMLGCGFIWKSFLGGITPEFPVQTRKI